MSQQAQNQSVTSQSTTPHPNQPQATNNKPARRLPAVAGGEPDAFARLAEAVDRTLKRLNHPKAEKSSAPKGTRLSRPATAEKTSASSGLLCGSGLQPRQNSASRDDFLLRASPACPEHSRRAQGIGSRPKDSATRPSPARGDLRSRARSGASTVSQAKNYLRATRPPKFLNPNRSLERHARKCAICHHPEREMIEELFIHWHSPQSIVDFLEDYDNVNWVSVYRHAYALGLDAVRRRNLGFVFENILDNAADATPTAAGVVAAARALSCVNSEGQWVEPEKHITMTTLVRKEHPASATSTESDVSSASADNHLHNPRSGEDYLLRASPAQGSCSAKKSSAQSFSSRERIEGRGPIPGLRSSPSDPETGARPSTSPRLPAVAGASARRSLAEESASVPSTSLPKAAFDALAAALRTSSSGPASAVRHGTREIRLPLNSRQTKDKPISNR